MSSPLDDHNSLVNGIPARHIGPETGASGDATMTLTGETSEGTNESYDSAPAPAAGLDTPIVPLTDEVRTFAPTPTDDTTIDASGLAQDEESIAQQIADGEGHIKHGQKLHERLHPHE